MKKMLRKAVAAVMALSMLLVLSACGGANYTAKNTEYVIGFSGPLTGNAAVYGVAVQNSAQMAVDEINAAGGLNGVKFKLVAKDDTHDATKVAANYSSMLEEGMQVSLGTVTTAPGLEFTKLSAEDMYSSLLLPLRVTIFRRMTTVSRCAFPTVTKVQLQLTM